MKDMIVSALVCLMVVLPLSLGIGYAGREIGRGLVNQGAGAIMLQYQIFQFEQQQAIRALQDERQGTREEAERRNDA